VKAGMGSTCGLGTGLTPDLRESARAAPQARKYRRAARPGCSGAQWPPVCGNTASRAELAIGPPVEQGSGAWAGPIGDADSSGDWPSGGPDTRRTAPGDPEQEPIKVAVMDTDTRSGRSGGHNLKGPSIGVYILQVMWPLADWIKGRNTREWWSKPVRKAHCEFTHYTMPREFATARRNHVLVVSRPR
jgi:hypothetical protein